MLLNDIQTHKIFTGFKDRKLELDLLICYPHGTGGNFIWDVLSNGYSASALEERNFNGFWMKLDHIPLARVETDLETHFDTLAGIAQTMRLPKKTDIARCHFPPVLTDLALDLRIDEIVFIEVRYEDKWFPTALSLIRNHLLTPWEGNPHLIELVLNHCIISGISQKIMVTDYLVMIDRLEQHVVGLPWRNSLLSWDYFIHCKQNGYVYGLDSLQRFLTTWIFRPDAYAYYSTDAYRDTRDLFTNKVKKHTVVDYSNLFFDGIFPSDGRLSDLDRHALKEYARSNLGCFESISHLIDDQYRKMVRDRISSWKSCL
jgi:hypothetical protein